MRHRWRMSGISNGILRLLAKCFVVDVVVFISRFEGYLLPHGFSVSLLCMYVYLQIIFESFFSPIPYNGVCFFFFNTFS